MTNNLYLGPPAPSSLSLGGDSKKRNVKKKLHSISIAKIITTLTLPGLPGLPDCSKGRSLESGSLEVTVLLKSLEVVYKYSLSLSFFFL